MLKKFKYTTRFDGCLVKASIDSSLDKYLSKASIEDLKSLNLQESIDLEKNIDLVGTVFNAAVINRLNRNDEGISSETAIAIKDLFIHKPHNLEHKSEKIVGHIIKAGWSSFGGNQILSDQEVNGMKEPFNLTLGGVVYRLVNERFADLLIESSDETSDKYMSISASWEIAFSRYNLVIGSKNIDEAEIISDEEKIKELEGYLKCNGGPGKLPDGRYIGRLIVGGSDEVLPVGMAFTTKPAAEVQGVAIVNLKDLTSEEGKSEVGNSDLSTSSKEDFQENNSQTIILNVNNNQKQNSIQMKFETIKDLITAASSKDGLSESSVADFLSTQIDAKSKEWEAKQAEKDAALQNASSEIENLKSELSKATSKINEVMAAFETLKNETEAKQKDADFQNRMSSIANEYELSTKETELVAKQISGLDEKSYASWFETFAVFNEQKKKTVIAKIKEEFESKLEEAKKLSKASLQEEIAPEKALESLKEIPGQGIANASPSLATENAKNEWEAAFGGENMKISV